MKRSILKSVGIAVLALAVNAGSVGSANAAIVVGNWDPLFGSQIPGLGWDLQATFYVPSSCLATPGPHWNYSSDCGSNYSWGLSSATVRLYDTTSMTPGVPIDILSFGQDFYTYVGINVAGGIVTGMSTFSTPNTQQGTSSSLSVDFYKWTFDISGINDATLIATAAYWGDQSKDPYHCSSDGEGNFNSDTSCRSTKPTQLLSMITYDDSGNEIGRIGKVPEPGSLALVLGALAGLGVVVRRRQG